MTIHGSFANASLRGQQGALVRNPRNLPQFAKSVLSHGNFVYPTGGLL
jgi:hypothetical protein